MCHWRGKDFEFFDNCSGRFEWSGLEWIFGAFLLGFSNIFQLICVERGFKVEFRYCQSNLFAANVCYAFNATSNKTLVASSLFNWSGGELKKSFHNACSVVYMFGLFMKLFEIWYHVEMAIGLFQGQFFCLFSETNIHVAHYYCIQARTKHK